MVVKAPRLPTSLLIKSLIVRTPLEERARQLRWLLWAAWRRKRPELWEVYLEEQRIPIVLQRLLKKDSCAVDVGGHIGSFLRLLVQIAPEGHHIVFEPSLTKSEWLKRRFPEVNVFSHAITNENGVAHFEENCEHPGLSTLRHGSSKPAENTARYQVSTCRLDDVLSDIGRFDLLKLDIEGGELAALQGAVRVIGRWKPAIIFECTPENLLSERKGGRMELFNFITKELSYNIFSLADFLFDKGEMTHNEFRKSGLYPFSAFNFLALSRSAE
jgi:FkbM family methyltransferase